MSSKNSRFAQDLASALEPTPEVPERPSRLGIGVLATRANRIAELASGAVVNNPQELVDPARCRIWEHHNRDYQALSEQRCADLIESIKGKPSQEVPAIVRRVSGVTGIDFEIIAGARRHWAVSWLREHNYPEVRYFIEIRELTDEQAFRLSDLENRAREDLSDLERARDYLKALGLYYGGRQKDMAQRMGVSESWLSRYLDLARLPQDIFGAFADPFELKISHIGQLKPILKGDSTRAQVLARAREIRQQRDAGESAPAAAPEVIRALLKAAEVEAAPKKSGMAHAPKKSGTGEIIRNAAGAAILRIDGKDRKGLTLTLLHKSGGSREDIEAALRELLDHHWKD